MTHEKIYLDLDFMPPVAERFFKIPGIVKEGGFHSICLKMMCSFPWEFESRMKADSYFPENVISHFFKLCTDAGISISFVFPGPGDFGRLLRLPAYSRLACGDFAIPSLNPESTGMKSFIESVIEDVVSLVPDIDYFLLQTCEDGVQEGKALELYNNLTAVAIESTGYKSGRLPSSAEFQYAENVFAAVRKSRIPGIHNEMQDYAADFETAAFKIRQWLTMSSLSCSSPAAFGENPADMYRSLSQSRESLNQSIEMLRETGVSIIDEYWLSGYLSSVRMTADEDFLAVVTRLRQLGIFKDT